MRRHVVEGTIVEVRSPWLLALWWVLSLGVHGAIWHVRTNRQLRDFGRQRPGMPFPYIVVNTAASALAYVFGELLLLLVVLAAIGTLTEGDLSIDDVMSLFSIALVTASLWITTRATALRLRTAMMLAGIENKLPRPFVAACCAMLFPAYQVYMQRKLNRLWRSYE